MSILQPSPLRVIPLGLGAGLAIMLAAGCADVATDMGIYSSGPPTVAPTVDKIPPVTQSGRNAAVLSVHMRKSYKSACKYGLTLTNNLPFKITALAYRITAIIKGDVPFDTQNKSFSGVLPGERQYRELTFQGVTCEEINRLEVVDPGRCNLGDLNRFNAEPGDCAKFSDLPSSRLVNVVWKKK
jgi:hypothetical protein